MLILLLSLLRGGGERVDIFQAEYTYLKTGAFEQKRRKKGGVDEGYICHYHQERITLHSISLFTHRKNCKTYLSIYWALFAHLYPSPSSLSRDHTIWLPRHFTTCAAENLVPLPSAFLTNNGDNTHHHPASSSSLCTAQKE